MRKQWPKLWESDEYGKRTSEPDDQVTHFLGIENGVVISHVKVFKRSFKLEDNTYLMVGLGEVLVRPEERGKGYGSNITDVSTNWIKEVAEKDKIDIAMLICKPDLVPFYSKFGWQKLPNSKGIKYGVSEEESHPTEDGQVTMAIYLSDKAKDSKERIESSHLYLGRLY